MIRARGIEVKWRPIGKACMWIFLAYGAAFLVLALLNGIPNFNLIAQNSPWLPKYIGDSLAFAISMVLIWRVSQGRLREFGFVLKGRELKLRLSVVLGVVLALIGILLDYLPKVTAGNPETGPGYPLTVANVLGMMSFQWIFVGIFEEPLVRGLVQTHLVSKLKGSVTIFKWDFHIGTVITAILFGVGHFGPHIFFGGSWLSLVPHLVIATLTGLCLGYIYQETGSLAGPVLMHNVYDGLVTTLGWFY
jgi:membrane protease YdiL (CAAX protease family)